MTAYDFRDYNPFRFSAEYADDALGLVYYNYRYYDANQGRWLRRDPFYEESFKKNWRYIHKYGYKRLFGNDYCCAQNSTIDHNDSLGLIHYLGVLPNSAICCKSSGANSFSYQEIQGNGFTAPCCPSGYEKTEMINCTCYGNAKALETFALDIGAEFPGAASDGYGDAMRHCVLSCQLSKNMGGLCSWFAMTAYEYFLSENSQMDYNNNAKGREIGSSNTSCISGCMDLLFSGQLRVDNKSDNLATMETYKRRLASLGYDL